MTISAALIDSKGHIWVGSDSEATDGMTKFTVETKIVEVKGGAVGIAGSPLVLHPLEIWSKAEDAPDLTTIDDVRHMVQFMRGHLEELGHGALEDAYKVHPFQLVVATSTGDLYVASAEGTVLRCMAPYAASGSGESIFTGAMEALLMMKPDMPGDWLLRQALKIACKRAVGCGGDLDIRRVS